MKKKLFIPYITAGDPDLDTTEQLIYALERGGADYIELGVPFSDPMADGPVIQRASERALQNNIGLSDILSIVERVRKNTDIPILLFTYYNPLLQFGEDARIKLKQAGVTSVLVTDLIPEEADEHIEKMKAAGLDTVFLAAPTTTDERLKLIAEKSTGFVYVIARTGVTGIQSIVSKDVRSAVDRLRHFTSLPIAVGFGISTPQHVSEVWTYADGAVVGSRLVLEIENNLQAPDLVNKIEKLTRELRNG